MDRDINGFLKHERFAVEKLHSGARCLPGIWIFSRKRDGTAKARFVVGGHRQIEGKDYFADQTYTAVLASRDNRILLSLAAAEGWMIAQSDIVQAFLHGVLDDATLFIQPPARYPCPPNRVLRLRKAVYGIHQAPLKFKREVVTWFRDNHYVPANAAETIWILRVPVRNGKDKVLVHAVYADDLLHFYNDVQLFTHFTTEYKKKFEVKTAPAEIGRAHV